MLTTVALALCIAQPLAELPAPPGTPQARSTVASLPAPPQYAQTKPATVPHAYGGHLDPAVAAPVKKVSQYDKMSPEYKRLAASGWPFVVFVGVAAPKNVYGVPCIRDDALPAKAYSAVVVRDGEHIRFDSDTPVDQLAHAAGIEVSQPAIPFVLPSNSNKSSKDLFSLNQRPDQLAPQAAEAEWCISREETEAVKRIWPANVVWPEGVKFYRIPQAYQNMWTTNGGQPQWQIEHPGDLESSEFLVSGGMTQASGFKSLKGLLIPSDKKIKAWKEATDVRAFGPTYRWRWLMPDGTKAFDVLFKDGSGSGDKVAEVRMHEKDAGEHSFRTLFRDPAQQIDGYHGLQGQSCAECHSHTAEVVNVPGRIYRRARWGDDKFWSFRPYLDSGALVSAWPIEKQ